MVLVGTLSWVECACSQEARKARHLERADQYFDQKEYREAVIEYRNVLQIEEDNAQDADRDEGVEVLLAVNLPVEFQGGLQVGLSIRIKPDRMVSVSNRIVQPGLDFGLVVKGRDSLRPSVQNHDQ